jgi:hypothetical protein
MTATDHEATATRPCANGRNRHGDRSQRNGLGRIEFYIPKACNAFM